MKLKKAKDEREREKERKRERERNLLEALALLLTYPSFSLKRRSFYS